MSRFRQGQIIADWEKDKKINIARDFDKETAERCKRSVDSHCCGNDECTAI